MTYEFEQTYEGQRMAEMEKISAVLNICAGSDNYADAIRNDIFDYDRDYDVPAVEDDPVSSPFDLDMLTWRDFM